MITTSHAWFRSGSYTLVRHIDALPGRHNGPGVVFVPPFGWEDICSYRPLKFLARALAAAGFPVLRFDLPGTANSSGSALDHGLVEAWIESIEDAAAELRASTGVIDVAALGVGAGAMLAATAASQGTRIGDLVLWGLASSGRALLRELQVFSRMEAAEYAGSAALPPGVEGLEVAGFLLTPETQNAIAALKPFSAVNRNNRRVLLLSRDDSPPDAKLVRAFAEAGNQVEAAIGKDYSAMMAVPHDAVPPRAAAEVIIDFLKRSCVQPRTREKTDASEPFLNTTGPVTVIEHGGSRVVDTLYKLGSEPDRVFGVLSEPESASSRSSLIALFLNPGSVRHIGSNRMWVEAARRWAARGIPVLRMDFNAVGESDGGPLRDVPGLYHGDLMNDIEAALAFLRTRFESPRLVLLGLCSGAHWAFQTALRHREVRAAVLLNPRCFFWDPEIDYRRELRRAVNGVTDSSAWRRLARGAISPERIGKAVQALTGRIRAGRLGADPPQIDPVAMARAIETIEKNKSFLTLVFTEGEPLLQEMEEEGHMPADNHPFIQCIRLANCGHTFRPIWSQVRVHEIIDKAIETVLHDDVLNRAIAVI